MDAERRHCGGPSPYGYRHDGYGRLVPVADELDVRNEIRQLYDAGYSYRGVARVLNERGQPTPKGGRSWSAATIMRLLIDDERRKAAQ
jgi:site-specific DNA recombinase